MATQLIGVHGVKQAGKDTVLGFMQQWCEAHDLPMVVRGFADELKIAIIMVLFGQEVSPEVANDFFDRYKEDPHASVKLSTLQSVKGHGGVEHIKVPCLINLTPLDRVIADATVRDLLTRFGTDVARDRWGKDFWVDRLLPYSTVSEAVSTKEPWMDKFVVPDDDLPDGVSIQARVGGIRDLRFPNELSRIRHFNGYVVKVRRDEAEQRVIAEAQAAGKDIHESDLMMDDGEFDVVFDNNGSLDYLAGQVDDFMSAYVRTML